MLHLFMKHPAAAALHTQNALKLKSHKRQNLDTVMWYLKPPTIFSKTYATDELIAETDAVMMQFLQLLKRSPTEYAEAM